MKQLLKYMKGYEKQCVLGPLFKLLEATFELLIPLVVATIVDTGIGSGDKGYIVKMCLVMVALAFPVAWKVQVLIRITAVKQVLIRWHRRIRLPRDTMTGSSIKDRTKWGANSAITALQDRARRTSKV